MRIFALAAAALIPSAPAWARQPVAGVVTALEGEAELLSESTTEPRPLRRNSFVYEDSTIHTSRRGRAAVAMIQGAELRIEEGSVIAFESSRGKARQPLSTREGVFWIRVPEGMREVELKSPMGDVRLAGEAEIRVKGGLDVIVCAGEARVANKKGAETARAGQWVRVVQAGEAPGNPQPLPAGGCGTWHSSLKAPPPGTAQPKVLRLRDKNGNEIEVPLRK